MSQKQRRELEGLSPAEVQAYFKALGKAVPPWYSNRNAQEAYSLRSDYEQAEGFLRALEDSGDSFDTPEIGELKALFLRALEAADLLQEMPRNKPKFRREIEDFFRDAWERVRVLESQGYDFESLGL